MRGSDRYRSCQSRQYRRGTQLSTRDVLALLFSGLFIAVCLIALLAPAARLEQLLPFVAPPITILLNYYFGRRSRR
jgi:hypothetical protein